MPVLFTLTLSTATARADTPVDTAYQSWGVAPRIEFEIGPQFVWGLGNACREEPAPADAEPSEGCNSSFFMLGGQAIALVRPFAHWALGVLYAYDAALGAHDVTVELPPERKAGSTETPVGKKDRYARSAKRLGVELRWYSRSVATSGMYVGVHAGALWWADKVKALSSSPVSQLAPEFGLEVGGVFAPYRGFGTTLGLQSWVGVLRNSPQLTTSNHGSTYGYGPFVFVGVVARLELGISM
ncbi:MAG TPA: hypothetical protein VFN67_25610 [Polyangiales bacterium]|nr:hypothetical protein [Polyangiales bacterium]